MSIIEMKVPTIGESINEVTLSQWLKPNGSIINLDDPICEFESDKATLEFPAEAAGKLIYAAEEGQDLKIGDLVARIDTSFAGKEEKAETKEAKTEAPAAEKPAVLAKAVETSSSYAVGSPSPAASKILAEKGVDTDAVKGSGKDGRITKDDAINAEKPAIEVQKEQAVSEKVTATAFSRNERTEKMSRMRKTIASRLVSAKNNTAMLTTFNEVDLTNINAMRVKYQEAFVAKYGIKLGYMSLFAKACATVLMEMPEINASIDGDNFIFHDYADISIAVSTPTGLVVPPVHNVESLQLHEIELKIKTLADKARNNKLTLDEMKGGTFTITNGGVFGSMMSTPILNEPQSAILGMHSIINRPVAINNQVEIRPMMYLAMSYDHRVIDGSSSVTFLVRVKKILEDPMLMFIGLV
ncbi:MAG: 2-oxoglutarate dehydrogenase complex dihydrolipoyllysine-residue succinyltransferase [Saprospiraceae bacterium]|jgi:2-oxoglutarate dehydrogenase E2 component (dihydrolipoamide succinyltransferase)|uniref:2-oxoglutarate dehydrogenase complex dihydrolipoyllysine-residue succinyltransferase n=1 Tax=Candidatus Brachybacter algidus TaxID=2982024 RepID=UPI001B436ADB|nr:2-oxoglutarate dehydrogenase complex dihydrolipoyllysine-residue succinyltransferase [Candidatus Brachybacter algidus]MBP7305355.1 2-oxoglutarate dehydrogenase complex dihydrolipoyllysine-residue succinyltransferase [Saprospiraceae bacterium]MBK6447498.1 2-oxoglutarate dehydrogenase complex dihydrolipoyllysine-residue succinyltransferase [Candidatus Brachybacter algidus]MBK9024051.1 2-oxoglutarate dehydrogenase complex dihydrolipoyllysine-residue succinyltransferase [Candidatus Brachybacter a